VALELSPKDHERRLSLGNLLIRVGVTKRLELRLGSEGLIHDASSNPVSADLFGRSDMDAGLKYKFVDEGHIRPAVSVIASLSFPLGTSGYTSNAYEPTVKHTWAKAMPIGFNASGNFNWDVLGSDQGRVTVRTTTLSVSHAIGKGFDEYTEIYGFTGSMPGEGTACMLQGGVARSMGVDAQWDVSVAHRITAQGPDLILSAGLAFRRPTGLVSRFRGK
jgi:hypothetical protein